MMTTFRSKRTGRRPPEGDDLAEWTECAERARAEFGIPRDATWFIAKDGIVFDWVEKSS